MAALHRAGYDRTIGVIVLAGAGARAFCIGSDHLHALASTMAAASLACSWKSSIRSHRSSLYRAMAVFVCGAH
ncbi:hypothetical protein [Xanthomonas hortorum]|uniref:hypothetical protein n=1 Tax=Xanthomonas hortorum TaxID=56454 RepID=UPI003D2F9A4E